jgi:hypothetical protein
MDLAKVIARIVPLFMWEVLNIKIVGGAVRTPIVIPDHLAINGPIRKTFQTLVVTIRVSFHVSVLSAS